MRHTVTLRPQAELDIDDIAWDLSERGGVDLGLRFYASVESTLTGLARLPQLGALRRFAGGEIPSLRVWRVTGFERYLVFYAATSTGIDVVRVLHAARDVGEILG